jgi:hypothetical protein
MRFGIPCVLASALVTSAALAQSTAFTYQGRLKTGTQLASGLHDMRFGLYNVATGGVALGGPQCVDNVVVTDGLFSVTLDFGAQFPTTGARFIQIEIRADTGLTCANATGFTTLLPRHPVTGAPKAVHANSASSLNAPDGAPANAVSVDNAGNVGVGTLAPTHTVHIANAAPTMALQDTNSTTDQVGYVSYRDSGNVERAWVGYGTPGSADFSVINARPGGHIMLAAFGGGNVGIGTATPTHSLHIGNAAPTIALQDTNSVADQVGYVSYRDAANAERAWVGYGTPGSPDFSVVNARPGGNIVLYAIGGGVNVRGSSGEFRVAAASEDLRMVRGTINHDGTIRVGAGFTSERVGTGLYRITLDVPFGGEPSVTVMAVQPFNQEPRWGTIHPNTITSALFDVFVLKGEAEARDSAFHFTAMGPR